MNSHTMSMDSFAGSTEKAGNYRGWVLFAGITMLVLGTAAVIYDVTATVASVFLFGCLLLIAGAMQIGMLNAFAVAQLWFVYLIVAWAFVTGALELAGAVALRQTVKGRMVRGEWLLGASGFLSLVFGMLVAARPDAGPGAFMWIIGGYAILSGTLLLALAVNIRSWPRFLPPGATA